MNTRTGQLALIAKVARSRELRRVQLAFVVFSMAEHATWLAVFVYALARGGAAEVGIVAVAQLAPAVVLTPFSAYAGDRFSPQRALAVGYGVQSIAMAGTAAAMWAGQPIAAYVLAAVAATSISFIRPVMGALLPEVTHAPADLVAANVVAGLIEQIGSLAGPLAAGIVLAVASPAAVFAVAAVGTGAACIAVLTVRGEPGAHGSGRGRAAATQRPDARDALRIAFAGFATLRRHARLRILLGVVAVAGLVKGVGDIVFVVFADDRLDGGGGTSGLLAVAYGFGGLLGALSATRLVRSSRIGGQLLAAGALLGVAMAGAAWAATTPTALVSMMLMGSAESLLVLTSTVSVQRQAPPQVLSRVFGIVEGTQMALIAVGSLLVSLLVTQWSLAIAFVAIGGASVAVLALLAALLNRQGDALPPVDDATVANLLADPVFAPLAATTIERLARNAERRRFATGDVIVREGEPGEHYFLVVDGTVSVSQDGRHLRDLPAGRSFGEIALLKEVPRTATVAATSDGAVLAVGRDDFLEAVTGHSRALSTASTVADRYLDGTAD
ncbi:MAG: MFS transporter [Actinobacteria bacterium]|nr:MFS transporter [Actinomycetota bacterium]